MSTPTCSGVYAAVAATSEIVVEFEFRLHPVGTRTLVAELTFSLDRAAALRGWRDLAEEAARLATLTEEVSGGTVTIGYVWVDDP